MRGVLYLSHRVRGGLIRCNKWLSWMRTGGPSGRIPRFIPGLLPSRRRPGAAFSLLQSPVSRHDEAAGLTPCKEAAEMNRTLAL